MQKHHRKAMGKCCAMSDVQTVICFCNFQFLDEFGKTYFTDQFGRELEQILDPLGQDRISLYEHEVELEEEAFKLQQEAQALRLAGHRFGAAGATGRTGAAAGAGGAAGAGAALPQTFRLVTGK